MAAHLILFNTDGSVKVTNSLKDLDSFFDNTVAACDNDNDNNNDDDVDDIDEDIQPEYANIPDEFAKWDMIAVGSFVAIIAPPSSFELFHVMKITKKDKVTCNIEDSSKEHCVLKREPYLIGTWISLSTEGEKFVKYKESKSTAEAMIHVGEVIGTELNFNDKLELSIHDFRI